MMDNYPNLFYAPPEKRVSFAELARQYEMGAIQPNNDNDDFPKMKRRVKLKLIDDINSRKATYRKRRAGLLKKLEQLAILCDIQACIAIYGPGDKSPTVWPSVEEAKEIVEKFEEIPEPERLTRMVTHQEYRQQKVIWMEKQLEKLKKLNDEREMAIFMHQVYNEHKPLSDFSDDELERFVTYVEDKLKAVRNRKTITGRSEASMSSQPQPPPAAVAVQPLIISGEVDSRVQDELLLNAEQQQSNFDNVVIPNGEPDDDFFGGLFFEDQSGRSVLFPAGGENELVAPPAEVNEEVFGFGDFGDSVNFGDLDNFGDLTVGTDDDDDGDLIDELLFPHQGNAAGNNEGIWYFHS